MTLDALKLLTLSRGKRTKRNALIYLYIIAYFSSFAYNYARTVFNKEKLSYSRAGVNVYTCYAVGLFRHNTRNHRYF